MPNTSIKSCQTYKKIKKNDLITIESDDPLSKYDFKNYCEENNFKIISIKTQKNSNY